MGRFRGCQQDNRREAQPAQRRPSSPSRATGLTGVRHALWQIAEGAKFVLVTLDDLTDGTGSLKAQPIEVEVEVGFGVRKFPAYDMDKRGFTMLAFGFTGAKANHFKLLYIDAFDAALVEIQRLRSQPALPDFTDPAIAARAWASEYEQKVIAQHKAARGLRRHHRH